MLEYSERAKTEAQNKKNMVILFILDKVQGYRILDTRIVVVVVVVVFCFICL